MKKDNLYTAVLAGTYKGKKLLLPSLEVTRSSKSILKESYFNRLQFDIIDKIFVELFAGSGSIGLEALSRGAKKIYFFEKDRDSYRVLQSNIKTLDPLKCQSFLGDSFILIDQLLEELKSRNAKAYFYIDPPFSIREGMEDIYEKTLLMVANIPPQTAELITIEHMSNVEFPDKIAHFTKERSKKFGKTTLSYYQNIS